MPIKKDSRNKKKKIKKGISEHFLRMLQEAEDFKFEGRHKEAINLVEKILFEDPTNVPALEETADNYLSLNKYKQSEKAAKRALEFDKDSFTSYYVLGFIRSNEQKWDEAIKYLSKANDLLPNNPEILRCLGWAFYNNKNLMKGIVTLERALNLDPNNSLTLSDLGVCYMHSRNFDKALSLFYKTLEIDPQNVKAKECILAIQGIESHPRSKK